MRVAICSRQDAVDLPAAEVRRVVRLGLRQEGREADLSIALIGDAEMRALNRRFLGRRRTTDVLAFPYGDEGGVLTGEIVVNADQAARVAAGKPHGAKDELMLYVVHGLLHLCGYDDHAPDDTRRMREREQAVLHAAGYEVEF